MKNLCIALLIVLTSGHAAFGAEPRTTLTFASVDNIPPYVFVEDGKLTGLSIDIINELARRSGFAIKISTFPWARVLLELEQGSVDGAFSAYMKEERKKYCLYTGIIHYDELRVAARKGSEFPFTGIESLYGKVVGKGRGIYVSDAFDQAVIMGNITVSEIDDMNMTNIKKLHEGRLDAVVGSPVAMMHYANTLGYENIVLLPGKLRDRIPAYLVLSKHSDLENKKDWQKTITQQLQKMRADGTIRTIYKRYNVDIPKGVQTD